MPRSVADRASALRGTAFLSRAALRSRIGSGKPFVLVNVGACDGVLFDDVTPWLHRIKNSRAVLVEPIPYNREKLRRNYPDAERHIIEPVVVSETTGRIEIKTFDENAIESGDLPLEFVGCSSIKDTNLVSGTNAWGEEDPNFERYSDHLKTIECDAEHLDTILSRNNIDHIDAFLVDCEGADWDVFSQLDFERWRPGMIKIEIGALNAEDIGNTILKLKRADYRVGMNAEDVWAFAK
jgi:FkbM family methyltransferase